MVNSKAALHPCAGFTLIEVMVAIALTAAIAAMAYTGLTAAVNAAERHQLQAEQLAELNLAMMTIERDLRQFVQRPVVDEYDETQSALEGGRFAEVLLRFTRMGWDNPMWQQRGTVQRVHYVYEDSALWRDHWTVLDRLDNSPKQRVLLLAGIADIRLRFGQENPAAPGGAATMVWHDQWPPLNAAGSGIHAPPLVVELTLETELWGELRRVFMLPG